MKEKEVADYLTRLVYAPKFPEGYFDIPIAGGLYLLGNTSRNERSKCLFGYKAYYEDIVDISEKIKISFDSAKANSLLFSDDGYNPFDKPSEQEFLGSYFAENTLFRVAILWDILAQLYNLKYQCGYEEYSINYKRIFHNESQKGEPFAQKVYTYITEENCTGPEDDTNMWKGNHSYVSKFRNSFTHRISQNITSITSTTNHLRPPVAYIFKRILEDYYVVSKFLMELIIAVHEVYFGKEQDNNA